MKLQFAWHVHHDRLVEPLTAPLAVRRQYIRNHKLKDEIPSRLRLLRRVRGALPRAMVEAEKAYREAEKASVEAEKASAVAWEAYCAAWAAPSESRKAYDEAWKAYAEAWMAYGEADKAYHESGKDYGVARRTHHAAIEALHQTECPNCPWNGATIFP